MRRIWAITRLTLAEAIRTRLALAFLALLVGLMILLITTATGDGTICGKVQMFLSYSISLTHMLLAVFVILLCCRTIDQDIKTQRIDSLVSKPIARWQFLFGRWLGIVLLTGVLFALAMILTYGMIFLYAGQAKAGSEDEIQLRNQVLVARASISVPPPSNIEEEVQKRYAELQKRPTFSEDFKDLKRSEIEDTLRQGLILGARTVPPEFLRLWRIAAVGQPKDDVVITLRYKFEPSTTTGGMPEAGLHGDTIYGQWVFGLPSSTHFEPQPPEERLYRTAFEITVPNHVIEADGTLYVGFRNMDPRGVAAHFPVSDGLEILVSKGSFAPNFIRAIVIAFATLIFLTTVALACSTFLSFPIASLVAISVLFIGLASSFLAEAIDMPFTLGESGWFEIAGKTITWAAMKFVPTLDVGTYTYKLVEGRFIEWPVTIWHVVKLAVVESVLMGIGAILIFNRRELGRVIV